MIYLYKPISLKNFRKANRKANYLFTVFSLPHNIKIILLFRLKRYAENFPLDKLTKISYSIFSMEEMNNYKPKLKKPNKKHIFKKKEDGITSDTGRPPIFTSAEELQKKIDEYFKQGFRKKKIITKDGREIEVPKITISDLVLFLGFSDRRSFYQYENKKEFAYTIKKARTFIEREYEELLTEHNAAGAIFALKNFGWTDRQEIDVSAKTMSHFENMVKKYE